MLKFIVISLIFIYTIFILETLFGSLTAVNQTITRSMVPLLGSTPEHRAVHRNLVDKATCYAWSIMMHSSTMWIGRSLLTKVVFLTPLCLTTCTPRATLDY